jgi:hypothetical protein
MARCGGGGEGRPARRARGGSAPASTWWRGAACGGGEGRAAGLSHSSWGRSDEVRRLRPPPVRGGIGETWGGQESGGVVGGRFYIKILSFLGRVKFESNSIPFNLFS